jgi:hypothetical protein
MDIAAEPVELGDDDWRSPVINILDALGGLEGLAQLWPMLERVALGALNLNEALDDGEALSRTEAIDCLPLCLKPQPRPALPFGALRPGGLSPDCVLGPTTAQKRAILGPPRTSKTPSKPARAV